MQVCAWCCSMLIMLICNFVAQFAVCVVAKGDCRRCSCTCSFHWCEIHDKGIVCARRCVPRLASTASEEVLRNVLCACDVRACACAWFCSYCYICLLATSLDTKKRAMCILRGEPGHEGIRGTVVFTETGKGIFI